MSMVLVSSCLLGEPVRYDGGSAPSRHPVMDRWLAEGRVVSFCPERAGGLGIPRPPVELLGGGGEAVLEAQARVGGAGGEDVTAAFIAGALAAVALCRRRGIRVAVLKERSPSCGSAWIHDGTFSGRLVPGQGVAAAALRAGGIDVFSEAGWECAQARLAELERT
ncbi:MAG TPA: DUF523 domain-containing protein [Holophaga sp.]|nr:DUF523 domain-containing protein [Holophaga sp.]HPS67201.1 DUF523 domain-containing protein [Holophaga sp.]